MSNLERESRHSDYGPDAGGYSVLRFKGDWIGRIDYRDIADSLIEYVESLEKEVDQWKTWGIIEIAVRNPNVSSYVEHWEDRTIKAEAEVERLREINKELVHTHNIHVVELARLSTDLEKVESLLGKANEERKVLRKNMADSIESRER